NQDGKRPESITVRLLANGEEVDQIVVKAENEWKYSFADLPKFENGEEINYTVQEDEVDDYSTEIDGFNITNSYVEPIDFSRVIIHFIFLNSVIDGFNITNSYTPEQTSINVVKAWDDAN